MNKKNLFIFTDSFPYGVGETYVASEIDEYHDFFNKIFIIPVNLKGEQRQLPTNCEVLDIHKLAKFNGVSIVFLFKAFSLFLYELRHTNYKGLYLNYFPSVIKKIYNAIVYAEALKVLSQKSGTNESIFYTYWFYHWALVCSIARDKNYIGNYFSRTHLGDLYEIRTKLDFKNLKLRSINKLYVISEHGRLFLKSHYSKFIGKVQVNYLGTPKAKFISGKFREDRFLIISCSSVKPIKRVDEIFRVICNLSFKVKWIHFGGSGTELEKLHKLVLSKPANVEVDLKGHVPNRELLDFYATHEVDLFINLSTTEGLPVSIMEAQSYSIPVLATNVFATAEAVVEGTGILVDEKASVDEITQALIQLKNEKEKGLINPDFILNHWNTHFNAQVNYRTFAKDLITSSE
jgi:glycosyltransferase involved in cell wall biosynthesis